MGRLYAAIFMLSVVGLGGCAAPPAQVERPAFMVPYAAVTNPREEPALAYHVLPANGFELDHYPRGEKTIYLPSLIFGYSAYSEYTYDQQPIGSPYGPSWRYRRVSRVGVTAP